MRLTPRPPPPRWLVDNADRLKAAVEAARAEAAVAQQWYLPGTAHEDLFLAQDVALMCPLYMSKLPRPPGEDPLPRWLQGITTIPPHD